MLESSRMTLMRPATLRPAGARRAAAQTGLSKSLRTTPQSKAGSQGDSQATDEDKECSSSCVESPARPRQPPADQLEAEDLPVRVQDECL